MKNVIKLSIIFMIAFVSCKKKENAFSKKEETSTPFPTIIDTINIKRFTFDDENSPWLNTASYEFYYLGKLNDTIYLEKAIRFSPEEPKKNNLQKKYEKYSTENPKYDSKYWGNSKIQIEINKSLKISNSIPVLIRNNNKDTIAIGYGTQIPITMEAQNEKKEWKPIQEKFIYMCGFGLKTIILPPNEIAITLAPIFKGNFKTKLRLKLGDNKSEPFWGYINKRQFESKFDGHGNYKKEYELELSKNNER